LAVGWTAASPAAWGAGHKLFQLTDPRLDEASGLAVGLASPSVLYAQNDSGDSARFFALDGATGATVAVCDVPGAKNVDWEDLAVTRDAAGVPSVWLADIGDNDAERAEIELYRVDEPELAASTRGATVATSPPDVWRLSYPDGAHDAESLVVNPASHRMFVLTKSVLGSSGLYEVPTNPSAARTQVLRKVGELQFDLTGTPGGPNVIGQLTATGAAMSTDGRVLAIRTYTDAYFFAVGAGDVPQAIKAKPARVALPDQPQGEGIALRAGSALIDSEGVGSWVYSVDQPALTTASPSPSRSAPTRSPAPTHSAAPTSLGSVHPTGGRGDGWDVLILTGALLVGATVVVLGCWGALTYQRRRFRP
jgi:hypothetical protein